MGLIQRILALTGFRARQPQPTADRGGLATGQPSHPQGIPQSRRWIPAGQRLRQSTFLDVPGPLLSDGGQLSIPQTSLERGGDRSVVAGLSSDEQVAVDFQAVEVDSRQYDDTPKAAQEWLRGFGSLKPRTDVSARLLSEVPVATILPILSRWVRGWFDHMAIAKNEVRRRRGRASRETLAICQGDFQWICVYICDYLQLDPRIRLPESDVTELLRNVLYVCTKIGEERDFHRVIDVLHVVYSTAGCPQPAVQESLFVLYGILGHLHEESTPENLYSCIDLISKDGRTAIDFGQTLNAILIRDVNQFPTARKNTHIKAMKGVVKYLTYRLTSHDSNIFKDDSLFTSLLITAANGVGELSEQLMALCLALIDEKERLDQTSDRSLEQFVALVVIIHKNTKESSRQSAPENGEVDASAGSRHSLCDHMVRFLSRVDDARKLLVFNRFFRVLNDMEATFSLELLKEVAENIIPSAEGEGNKVHLLLDIVRTFIRNMNMPTEVRQAAVGVIEDLAWTEDQPGMVSNPWPKDAVTLLVDDLIGLIRSEADLNVLGPLVAAAVRVAVRVAVKYPDDDYMQKSCKALEARACMEESDFHGPKAAEVAARGLASVFIQSLITQNDKLTLLSFRLLTNIAGSLLVFAEARLVAMRTLFRIRCDSGGRIFVTEGSDSEYIAAALCRTDESAAKARVYLQDQDDNTARNSGVSLRRPRSEPPLWTYPGPPALPVTPDPQPSASITAPGVGQASTPAETAELPLSIWMECVINCLQKDQEWETYGYIIVHLGAQLSDVTLFEGIIDQIRFLRGVLCEKVRSMSFHEPPAASGLKKGDVAQCLFNILTALIAYHPHFEKNGCDELVKAFLVGIGSFEGTSRGCIHALFVCCLEIPSSVMKNLSAIIRKLQTSASQMHLSMHVLEFFAALARLPEVHTNLHEAEIRPIFGICVEYMKTMRDRDGRGGNRLSSSRGEVGSAGSGQGGLTMASPRSSTVPTLELPQYVTTLAYHTMIFWFLSLKLSDRAAHVPWIVKSLIVTDKDGNEHMEEMSQVLIDMMQRTAYSDLGETKPSLDMLADGGVISSGSWIVGNSILTLETAGASGWTQITKRQASGTTHSIYRQLTTELPSHHIPVNTDIRPESSSLPTEILPPHVLLQMLTTSSPTSLVAQPIPLPNKDFVKMALNVFDHHPTIDGHKVAVIYIGPGQSKEADILANTRTSPDFEAFLSGLGTKIPLATANFNTQGLRADCDGEHTYAWRDRVSEIVYHVPSMMPTDPDADPSCIAKKAHIGNDHVSILFNHSGAPLDFHTFPSQFNYINIVVTPACRPSSTTNTLQNNNTPPQTPRHYKVHTQTAPTLPPLSPAAHPKILSASTLPSFVRLIALNACVFSLVWRDALSHTASPDTPPDAAAYPSSWRQRLRDIHALRARCAREAAAQATKTAAGAGGKAGTIKASGSRGGLRAGTGTGAGSGSGRGLYPVGREGGEWGAVERDKEGEGGKLVGQYDFLRWTEG